jgi:hypothetical protein
MKLRPAPFPFLNWKELERFCALISPQITGAFIDRVIVPDRPKFPLGFLKGEWALRIDGKKGAHVLLCSVRPQKPSITHLSGKGPQAAPEGTRSPFDLALSKQIRGARILGLESLPRERMAVLWVSSEGRSPDTERLGLLFKLIPAQPEAFLIKVRGPFTQGTLPPGPWPIVVRSRTVRGEGAELFQLPDASRAPPDLPLREEVLGPGDDATRRHAQVVEEALNREAWDLREGETQRLLREKLQHSRDRSRQSATSQREAENEPEWRHFGDLLKAHLHAPPAVEWEGAPGREGSKAFRSIQDWNTGDIIRLPCDPRLPRITARWPWGWRRPCKINTIRVTTSMMIIRSGC